MKLLSLLTLTALFSITACSHHKGEKACCAKAKAKEEKVTCEKPETKKDAQKACCKDDSCKKKS